VPYGVLFLRDSGFHRALLVFDPLVSRYSTRSMLAAATSTMDALWSNPIAIAGTLILRGTDHPLRRLLPQEPS
jgi:hypothetical protein